MEREARKKGYTESWKERGRRYCVMNNEGKDEQDKKGRFKRRRKESGRRDCVMVKKGKRMIVVEERRNINKEERKGRNVREISEWIRKRRGGNGVEMWKGEGTGGENSEMDKERE